MTGDAASLALQFADVARERAAVRPKAFMDGPPPAALLLLCRAPAAGRRRRAGVGFGAPRTQAQRRRRLRSTL